MSTPMDRAMRARQLSIEARAVDAGPRGAFLDSACAQDTALRAEVEALLSGADDETLATFERPSNEEPRVSELLAGMQLGAWRVFRLIGRGGMGEVYEIERADGSFELRAAAKLLKHGMDTDAVIRRFLLERRILAQLAHPNIARLLDAGMAPDGRPFLVMEYIEGVDILEYARLRQLPTRERLGLMATVCETVQTVHAKQVVHRDIKPSNVMVTPDGQVKLLDFGIAKLMTEDNAEFTRLAGEAMALTPTYAAPEQFEGQGVTPATDVYALGVMLYQLLTDELPHRRDAASSQAMLRNLKDETLRRPSTVLRQVRGRLSEGQRLERLKNISGDLDLIVLKALHADSARRYPTARELAEDLQRLLSHRPVLARPDSLAYRAIRFTRRNRTLVFATAAVVAALGAGLVAALWQAQEARAQERQAERVKSVLISIFRQADPEKTQGQTITARAALEQGQRQIENQLRDEPLAAADLYQTLAQIYDSLGLYAQAQELAQRGLDLRRANLSADDPRIIESLWTTGTVLIENDQSDKAQPLLDQAAALAGHHGHMTLQLARIQLQQAMLLSMSGKRDEALRLQTQAYEATKGALGPNDPETGDQADQLGQRLEDDGDYVAAEKRYREALAIYTAKLGSDSEKVGGEYLLLGGVLDRVDRPDEADQFFLKAISLMRKIYGDKHPHVAEALFSRSILLIGRHRFADADSALAEALEIYPANSYKAAQCRRYLGVSLLQDGRYPEAKVQLKLAITGLHDFGPADDVQQYRAMADLATVDIRSGNPAAAEAPLREAVRQLERLTGLESYEVRTPLKRLGEALVELGRYNEALPILDRTHALELKLLGSPDNRDLAITEVLQAEALLGAGDPSRRDDARKLAEHALVIYRKRYPDGLIRPLLACGRAALLLGDGTTAALRLHEALTLQKAEKEPDHDKIAKTEALLHTAERLPQGNGDAH